MHGASRRAHERRGGSADGAALTFTPPLRRLSIKFSLLISAEAPSPLLRVLAPRSLTRDFPLHSLVFIGVVLVPRFSGGPSEEDVLCSLYGNVPRGALW